MDPLSAGSVLRFIAAAQGLPGPVLHAIPRPMLRDLQRVLLELSVQISDELDDRPDD
jgi:hypothetical protein